MRKQGSRVALLAVLAIALAAPAQAQTKRIYKIVGPDGKVTFSDTPPMAADSGPAGPGGPPAAAGAGAPKVDPAVEKALVALMGYESIAKGFLDVCVQALPTSAKRYQGTAEQWRARHAGVLAKVPVILAGLSGAGSPAAVRSEVDKRTRTMMAPVYGAPMPRKIQWCDQSASELEQGRMDLAPAHVAALQGYQPRR